jgi:transcriptional repressor NrdR
MGLPNSEKENERDLNFFLLWTKGDRKGVHPKRALMKCPFCGEIDSKVIESRLIKDEIMIQRRRKCILCNKRFTTREHIEEIPVMIMKKDGRRELFNREKVRSGIKKACEKRDISMNVIEEFIDDLERDLHETGEKEMPASIVGEKIMAKLHELDAVAYVRFASVYREFRDINDFMIELRELLSSKKVSLK